MLGEFEDYLGVLPLTKVIKERIDEVIVFLYQMIDYISGLMSNLQSV